MSKIIKVDYELMATHAREMREYGKQLNKEILNVYSDVTSMHEFWYGKRYNALQKSFNGIVLKLNEMLTLVVGEMPYALEVIANNYAIADRGQKVVNAENEIPNKISELKLSEDEGMRFLSAEVMNIQQKISGEFENAKEEMNKIERGYNMIPWESESAEAFKLKFTKLKNDIIASFENINGQFKELMKQTENDIEQAEKNNNVG